MHKYVYDIVIY